MRRDANLKNPSRRRLLVAAGASLAAAPIMAMSSWGWPRCSRHAGFDERHLTVSQIGGGETAQIAFRTSRGIADMPAVNELSWLFRDWRDRDMGLLIDVRLFDMLAAMQTLLTVVENRPVPFLLHSGYRTPERNRTIEGAAIHSQHIVGRAADISAPGVDHAQIVKVGELAGAHGLGRYPDFTHIDVGPRGRRWSA